MRMLNDTCRAAHEAMLRPDAAAALAAILCSLSPSAAAGQQLLLEVEGMLRVGGGRCPLPLPLGVPLCAMRACFENRHVHSCGQPAAL